MLVVQLTELHCKRCTFDSLVQVGVSLPPDLLLVSVCHCQQPEADGLITFYLLALFNTGSITVLSQEVGYICGV